jgi:hypothetical protein
MHLSHVGRGFGEDEAAEDAELPWEPAEHGQIATGSISSCQEFLRSFVRSSVVMDLIEHGYALLWTMAAPHAREIRNASSAMEHHQLVSGAVSEMMAEGVVTRLPPGEKPMVVSPLGVVPKRGNNKFRLTVNMRYVNRHLGNKVFKFVGLKDLADLAKRGDHAVSYDLMSGYYHVGLHPRSRTFVGFCLKGQYCVYNCLPFGLSKTPWVCSKVIKELMMY